MSILVDQRTRVLVQGITGRDGSFHARSMMEYGTQVVAGVTPGKGGTLQDGVPVYDSVIEAAEAQHANTALIFVPPAFAADAILEAASSPRIRLVVCITEGIPTLDMARVHDQLRSRPNAPRLLGPNCPGLISPGKCKVGIMPGHIHMEGRIGLVSRSGTLTYEVVHQLTLAGIGQSTCIGIGGDPIIGTTFLHALEMFEADSHTDAVVMIGEIGGTDEEEAARFIGEKMSKPVVGFIAGQTAPPGKRMGHAGAIISGGSGTAAEKIRALEEVGVPVAGIPSEIPSFLRKMVSEHKPRPAAKGVRPPRAVVRTERSERPDRPPRRDAPSYGGGRPQRGQGGPRPPRAAQPGRGYRTDGPRSEGRPASRVHGRPDTRPTDTRAGSHRPDGRRGAPDSVLGGRGSVGPRPRSGPSSGPYRQTGASPRPGGRPTGRPTGRPEGRPAQGGKPTGRPAGRREEGRTDSRAHLRQESSRKRPATRGGARVNPAGGPGRRGGGGGGR